MADFGVTEAIAAAGLVTAAAGTAATAVGGIQSAHAAAATAAYQAQIAANNSETASNNAAYAIRAGEAKAQAAGLRQRQQLAALEAGQAASGVDVNSDSATDARASQREINQYDTEDTLHNAYLTAYGYKTQGANFQAQSGLNNMQSKEATASIPLTTSATLLEGASGLADKWTMFQKTGTLRGPGSNSLGGGG